MNYVKSFDFFGVPAKQIPSITGKGAPTITTEGAVGCLYMDTNTGMLYKCVATTNNSFTWVELENGSGGLDSIASTLLICILRNAVYNTDQSTNITALEEALASSGEVEAPEAGIEQIGSVLAIVSGVELSQSGSILSIT